MVDMPKVVVNISVTAEIERPRQYSWKAFLMVAKTDSDDKKKKKKKTETPYS